MHKYKNYGTLIANGRCCHKMRGSAGDDCVEAWWISDQPVVQEKALILRVLKVGWLVGPGVAMVCCTVV